jgi:NADH-quinone oxidoreductase subunit M
VDLLGFDILSLLIVVPLVGSVILLFLSNKWAARIVALVFATFVAGISAAVFFGYNTAIPGVQLEILVPWFEAIGANWHIGLDGVSAAMILLTGILTPLAVLISWEVEERVNFHMALILFFQVGLMGVFISLDMMIFFLFYELSLVPMYFIINQWGGPNRKYASTKFFIYSLGGSLGMLLAIQLIGGTAGTFDIVALSNPLTGLPSFTGDNGSFLGLPVETVKTLAFLGFFVAFCIKVPVWPFHTWLPDAHGEAPTAGSMLLAGVMLKLGAFGFLRIMIPMFPDIWAGDLVILGFTTTWAHVFAVLALLGIILGAFAAFGQNDIKRLVAYSSVNHMGFVALGLAVAAYIYGKNFLDGGVDAAMQQTGILATNGAVLQMFNHGLTSAGMFLLAGAIYHKTHTRDMTQYGGFWVKAPIYGGIFIFMSMASLGLPGLNGFVSEFLVVRGAWPVFTVITALAMIGLLFTGSYILKGIRAVLHGPFNMHWKDYNLEITAREFIAVAPLVVLILITGLAPNWILATINATVTRIFGG